LALWISAVLTDAPPTLSEKRPGRRSAATLLTKDEARRIAVNIAKFAPDPPAGFNIAAHENNYLSQKNKISSGARVRGLQKLEQISASAPLPSWMLKPRQSTTVRVAAASAMKQNRDVAIGNPDCGWNQFVLICVPQAILATPAEPARQLERRLQHNHK